MTAEEWENYYWEVCAPKDFEREIYRMLDAEESRNGEE